MTSNRQVEMTLTSSRRWNNHPNCAKQCSSPVASPFDNKCGERSAAPACNGLPSRSAGVGDSDGSGDLGDVGSNSSGGSETAKCPSPADDTREGELDVGSNFNNRCCRNSRAGGVSPLIVFDWDDTMLTSSWIQSRELLQAASYDELPADTRQDLAHLEQRCVACAWKIETFPIFLIALVVSAADHITKTDWFLPALFFSEFTSPFSSYSGKEEGLSAELGFFPTDLVSVYTACSMLASPTYHHEKRVRVYLLPKVVVP